MLQPTNTVSIPPEAYEILNNISEEVIRGVKLDAAIGMMFSGVLLLIIPLIWFKYHKRIDETVFSWLIMAVWIFFFIMWIQCMQGWVNPVWYLVQRGLG